MPSVTALTTKDNVGKFTLSHGISCVTAPLYESPRVIDPLTANPSNVFWVTADRPMLQKTACVESQDLGPSHGLSTGHLCDRSKRPLHAIFQVSTVFILCASVPASIAWPGRGVGECWGQY